MGLTRPRINQLNSSITSFTDPLLVINRNSTVANIDVGFIFNRDGGTKSNVAVVWSESANTFVLGYTANTGETNANITISQYANVRAGYFIGDGSQLTGLPASYGNSNVASYLTTYTGNISAGNITVGDIYANNYRWANGVNILDNVYSNLGAVSGSLSTLTSNAAVQAGNIATLFSNAGAQSGSIADLYTIKANLASPSFTGNVNITGNLFVSGNMPVYNTNNVSLSDGMIYLADGNSGNVVDLGVAVAWTDAVRYQHGGLVRDATDGVWKLFGNVTAEPTTTIDFTNAIYQDLRAGNVTVDSVSAGNATTTGTVRSTGNITVVSNGLGNVFGYPSLVDVIQSDVLSWGLTVRNQTAGLGYGAGIYVDNIGGVLFSAGKSLSQSDDFLWYTPITGNLSFLSNGNLKIETVNDRTTFFTNVRLAGANVASTSTTTGALVVGGGIGASGNVYVGNIHANGFFWSNGVVYSTGTGGPGGATDKISSGASNVTVTTNYVNVAIVSSNVASFNSGGVSTPGNVFLANSAGGTGARMVYNQTAQSIDFYFDV